MAVLKIVIWNLDLFIVEEKLASARALYQQRVYQRAEAICLSVYSEDPLNADNLLLLGAIYFQCRLLDQSVFYSKLATKANPSLAEAYGNLGNALKEKGDVNGALHYYQKALSLKPFVEGYSNLAVTYTSIGLLQEAEHCYKCALQINPELLNIYCDLGYICKLNGKLEEAKNHYMQALKKNPDYSVAWNNLGCVHMIEKNSELALKCYQKACKYDPLYFDAFVNLASWYKENRDYKHALHYYCHLLKLQPTNSVIYVNIASLFYDRKDWDTAIGYYVKAIELQPDFADAYCNMGNAFKEKADVNSAIHNYYVALSINPNHPDTLNNLANVMKDQRRLDEACSMYIQALQARPTFAAAHSNLASVYKEMKRYNEAKFHYGEALRLNPEFSDAYSNLGNLLKEIGAVSEALSCYTRAVHINPSHADAYSNIASTCKDSNDIANAICYYRKALELKGEFPDAFCNLEHCLQLVCDWKNLDARISKIKSIVSGQLALSQVPSVQPHHTMLYPLDDYTYLNIAKAHGDLAKTNSLAYNLPPFDFSHLINGRKGRLRIGYVSSDFGNHPTSHLMQSVPGFHDRNKCEVFCYALSANDGSAYRIKLEKEAEHFIDLSVVSSDGAAARKIFEDEIHVLINLNGYTKGARNEIFALKPAPIQVMWLGYPGTSGSPYMDYIITDKVTSPMEFSHMYSETFIYMPHTFFVGDHKQMFKFMDTDEHAKDAMIGKVFFAKHAEAYGIPPLKSLSKKGPRKNFSYGRALPIDVEVKVSDNEIVRKKRIVSEPNSPSSIIDENGNTSSDTYDERPVVFCNFNQLYKIDPEIFDVWLNILKRVPNSVLWLLQFPPLGEMNLRKLANEKGVPAHQIVFSGLAEKEEHIFRGRYADMFLDTPLCNGHTTGMDILWAGTPMLTMPKKTFPSRVAASLLTALGCGELVKSTYKEYEDFAVKFGNDGDLRIQLKAKVERRRHESPLFDTKLLSSSLERAYEEAWNVYKSNISNGKPGNNPQNHPIVLK